MKTLQRTAGASASPRLRAVAALTGLLATVLLVGRVASTTGEGARVGLVVGAVAFILQVVSVLVWPAATGPAAGLLGLLAGAALLPAANRGLAVEMVVLFLASVELTTWAARLRSVVPETGASIRRQLGEVGAVVASAGVLTAVMVATTTGVGGPSGRGALVVGLVAVLVPVVILASRRWRTTEP